MKENQPDKTAQKVTVTQMGGFSRSIFTQLSLLLRSITLTVVLKHTIFSSPKHPDWLWSPNSCLLFKRYQVLFIWTLLCVTSHHYTTSCAGGWPRGKC